MREARAASAASVSAGSSAASAIQRSSTSILAIGRQIGAALGRPPSVSVGGRSSIDASEICSTTQSKRPLSTTWPQTRTPACRSRAACHGAPQFGHGNVLRRAGRLAVRASRRAPNSQRLDRVVGVRRRSATFASNSTPIAHARRRVSVAVGTSTRYARSAPTIDLLDRRRRPARAAASSVARGLARRTARPSRASRRWRARAARSRTGGTRSPRTRPARTRDRSRCDVVERDRALELDRRAAVPVLVLVLLVRATTR